MADAKVYERPRSIYNFYMLSARRLLLISRPIVYVPAMSVFAAGFLLSSASLSWRVIIGLVFVTFPMGLIIYGINDIADRESDAANPRKGGVDGAVLQQDEVKKLVPAIVWVAVLYALLTIITRQYAMLVAMLIIYLFAYTYSVKPIRLKTRPVLDSISNGIWIGAVVMTGYWSALEGVDLPLPAANVLLSVVLFAGAYHAMGTVIDYDTDKKIGDNTIGVMLGKVKTLLLCAGVFAVCGVLLWPKSVALGSFAIVCMLLSLLAARYNSAAAVRKLFFGVILLLPIAIFYWKVMQ